MSLIRRMSGPGVQAGVAGAALAAQAWSWCQMSAPLMGGGAVVDQGATLPVLVGLAAGAWVSRRSATAWRWLQLLLPAAGGLLGLFLAPLLLHLPSVGPLSVGAGLLAAALVLGPAALQSAGLMARRGVRWVPWWLGLASGSAIWLFSAAHLPALIFLVVFPLLAAAILGWGRRSEQLLDPGAAPLTGGSGSLPALGLAACVTALVLLAWSRFFILLGGTILSVRVWLIILTLLGAAAGAALGRHLRGRWAALACFAVASVVGLAAMSLSMLMAEGFLALLVEKDTAAVAMMKAGAWTLFPLAALCAAGMVRLADGCTAAAAGSVVARGVAAALLLESLLLTAGLAPVLFLVFATAAVALGGALPAALKEGEGLRPWQRLLAPAAVLGLAAVALLLPRPPAVLLHAGLSWAPMDFTLGGSPSLADALGRRRLLQEVVTPAGVLARLQISGGGESFTWQGVPVAAAAADSRPSASIEGLLAALVHPRPRRALAVGAASREVVAAWTAVWPDMEVEGRWPLPGGNRLTGMGHGGGGGPSRGFDLIHLQPLAPRVSATGRAFSKAALTGVRASLAPGGMVALALDPVPLTAASFTTIVATFLQVFPHASLWSPDATRLLLLGPTQRLELQLQTLEMRFRQAAHLLAPAGLLRPVDLLGRFLLPAEGLAALTAAADTETLARPRLAFQPAPRPDRGDGAALLARLPMTPDVVLTFFHGQADEGLREQVRQAGARTSHVLAARGLVATDLQLALERLRQARDRGPEDIVVSRLYGQFSGAAAHASLSMGEFDDALAWSEQAVRLLPDEVVAHLQFFDLLERGGRTKVAQRRLNDMATRFPGSYPVLLLLAQRRLDQGDVNAGDLFLRRAAATGYDTADLALGLARVAFERGLVGNGRRLVARAVAMAPDGGSALAYIGGRLLAAGQVALAEDYLLQARDGGRRTADVLGPLGELALQRQQHERATELLEAAVQDAPRSSHLRLNLGSSLLLSGRSAEAVIELEEALLLAPDDPLVRLNLGAALLREGRVEEARTQIMVIGDALRGNVVLHALRRDLDLPPLAASEP